MKLDVDRVCQKRGRLGKAQFAMCNSDERELVHEMSTGVDLAISECQHQFKDRLWNCSTTGRKSMTKFLKRGIIFRNIRKYSYGGVREG